MITEVSGWERRRRKLEKECKMYNAQLKLIIRDDCIKLKLSCGGQTNMRKQVLKDDVFKENA